jgi:hypothetical protein
MTLLTGFKKFLLRGNVVDLAVEVVVGTAFAALVKALVADLLTPIIALIFGRPKARTGAGRGPEERYLLGSGLSDTTEIVRPRRPRVNWTVPASRAKIVWSRPMPTPLPGWNTVPRWRTMISPPVTAWPANTLTPSRLALESRPLRLEPRPFLCAI